MPTKDAPRTWPRLALAAVLVLGFAGFYLLGFQEYISLEYVRGHLDELRARVDDNAVLAVVLFFALYAAVTGLSLPVAAPLSLLAGAIFGVWLGTAIVILAATTGATLAFLSSRYLFRDLVQRRFGPRLEPLNRGIERDGAYYLFTLRLVPLFPFFLINLGMGLTRLPLGTYVWISLVGMLPGTFLYVNTGKQLASITSLKDVLSVEVLGSLALLGIVPLCLRLLLRRKTHQPDAPARE